MPRSAISRVGHRAHVIGGTTTGDQGAPGTAPTNPGGLANEAQSLGDIIRILGPNWMQLASQSPQLNLNGFGQATGGRHEFGGNPAISQAMNAQGWTPQQQALWLAQGYLADNPQLVPGSTARAGQGASNGQWVTNPNGGMTWNPTGDSGVETPFTLQDLADNPWFREHNINIPGTTPAVSNTAPSTTTPPAAPPTTPPAGAPTSAPGTPSSTPPTPAPPTPDPFSAQSTPTTDPFGAMVSKGAQPAPQAPPPAQHAAVTTTSGQSLLNGSAVQKNAAAVATAPPVVAPGAPPVAKSPHPTNVGVPPTAQGITPKSTTPPQPPAPRPTHSLSNDGGMFGRAGSLPPKPMTAPKPIAPKPPAPAPTPALPPTPFSGAPTASKSPFGA